MRGKQGACYPGASDSQRPPDLTDASDELRASRPAGRRCLLRQPKPAVFARHPPPRGAPDSRSHLWVDRGATGAGPVPPDRTPAGCARVGDRRPRDRARCGVGSRPELERAQRAGLLELGQAGLIDLDRGATTRAPPCSSSRRCRWPNRQRRRAKTAGSLTHAHHRLGGRPARRAVQHEVRGALRRRDSDRRPRRETEPDQRARRPESCPPAEGVKRRRGRRPAKTAR